jgi:hypothetical protein
MGWRFKKPLNFGCFPLNLSRRGLGAELGIPRVSNGNFSGRMWLSVDNYSSGWPFMDQVFCREVCETANWSDGSSFYEASVAAALHRHLVILGQGHPPPTQVRVRGGNRKLP